MASRQVVVFLCGDVMTGRGIDQILGHSCDPAIYERAAKSAADYVALAEARYGRIPRRAPPEYIWAEALDELDRVRPAARVINLETSITTSDLWVPKGINYRMHPANVACLRAAGIDCCTLANNHVLDWGREGLTETLAVLRHAGIRTAGAGLDGHEAGLPAVLPLNGGGRLLVFAAGSPCSGVPLEWAATAGRAGVWVAPDLSLETAERFAGHVRAIRQRGDVVVFSIHWGDNWGYNIPEEQVRFAHALIDAGAADVVCGHSSHHPKAMEVYRGRLVLYGCGDLINDYEGIGGYEGFRGELSLLYFARLDRSTGQLLGLEMTPMRIRRFRLERAAGTDASWLETRMAREAGRFGGDIRRSADGRLVLDLGLLEAGDGNRQASS